MSEIIEDLELDDEIDWEELLEEEDEEEEDGEEDEDEDDDDDDNDEGPVIYGRQFGKTFSQRDLNWIMSREKKAGRKSGQRKVLEALGVDSIEEAKEKLSQDGGQEEEDKGKTPEDKAAAEQARKDREAAAADRAEAKRLKLEAKVERKLLAADVKPDKIEKALRLIDFDDIDDGDTDDIESAVADLKEDTPEWFKSDDDDEDDDMSKSKSKKPPSSNPGGVPRKKGQPSSSDRASARLRERHGNKLSKSD